MVSPGCAFCGCHFSHGDAQNHSTSLTTDDGVYTRPAAPPTVTLNWAAVTWTTAVARRAESWKKEEKCMSSRLGRKEGKP